MVGDDIESDVLAAAGTGSPGLGQDRQASAQRLPHRQWHPRLRPGLVRPASQRCLTRS